eukprot:m.75443 g.75443  ORF g.75443 m.75443 type:complete len:106 (+) comp35937_c0_seq21:1407-1724(+)
MFESPSISITPSGTEVCMEPSESFVTDLLSPQFTHLRSLESSLSSPVTSPHSTRSTLSALDDLDENPSVVDWCEFLGDSRNVIENDFSILSLSGFVFFLIWPSMS